MAKIVAICYREASEIKECMGYQWYVVNFLAVSRHLPKCCQGISTVHCYVRDREKE